MLLPSEYPEVAQWPRVRELLRIQVDMQFADLATLLCLPRDEAGLGAGCNLTAATLAFNIVAGASVLFWESSIEGFEDRRSRGRRFTGLMTAKYPWSPDDAVDAESGAELMWDYTRSPLTHTLGVGKTATLFPGLPKKERGVWLVKAERGLPADVVDELMSSCVQPNWLPATVTEEPGGYVIHVDTLAWGVTRMLRNLFADHVQAQAAEGTATELISRP